MPTTPRTDPYHSQLYTDYGIETEYELHEGIFTLPIAETVPVEGSSDRSTFRPTVQVRAHAPFRVKKVKYAARKETSPPLIPSPQNTGADAFIGGSMSFPSPTLNSAGDFTWTAYGTLAFVEDAISDPKYGFVLASLPWVYQSQVYDTGSADLGSAAANGATAVAAAGIGPRTGYSKGQGIDLDNPVWQYREVSYFPPKVLSSDVLTGTTVYPSLG